MVGSVEAVGGSWCCVRVVIAEVGCLILVFQACGPGLVGSVCLAEVLGFGGVLFHEGVGHVLACVAVP